MFAFIISRIAQSIFVMLVVAMVAFMMFNYVGDPVHQMVGVDTSLEERELLRQELGLNDPAPIQFARYIKKTVQGDFGLSYQHKRPVTTLFRERLPATLELSFMAAFFSLLVGIPMGVYTGLNRNSKLSRAFMAFSLIGVSLPTFLIGILFIYIFSVILGWLPSYGRGEVVALGFWTTGLLTKSGLKSLIMPAVTLGLFQLTLVMRLVRSEMLEVLRTDYIKFARARGLSNRAVKFNIIGP